MVIIVAHLQFFILESVKIEVSSSGDKMWKQTSLLAATIALVLIASAAMVQGRYYERGDDVPSAADFYDNGYRHTPAFLTPPKFFESKTFSTLFGTSYPWDK